MFWFSIKDSLIPPYLQEISYVDDERSRSRCNVDLLILMEDLQAANFVLQKYGQEA